MPSQALPAKCPHCGFAVLTNRYPKCERCDRQLPKDMVLSEAELAALFARERDERAQAARQARRSEWTGRGIGIGTDAPSGLSVLSLGDLIDPGI